MNFKYFLIAFFTFISFVTTAQNTNHTDTSATNKVDSSNTGIFEKVDIEASFQGGDTGWRKFMEKNLRADVASENGAPVGKYTVWVQFIVDKNGNVSDIVALTNNGYGMEGEVVRLIKNSPQWQPASQNGRLVKAYRKQPVTFIIEQDDIHIVTDEPYTIYSGIENRITIAVDKVKAENLEVTISQGTIISKGNDSYIVRVSKPGKVNLQLFNKKHKLIGEASLEVKQKGESSVPPTRKS